MGYQSSNKIFMFYFTLNLFIFLVYGNLVLVIFNFHSFLFYYLARLNPTVPKLQLQFKLNINKSLIQFHSPLLLKSFLVSFPYSYLDVSLH